MASHPMIAHESTNLDEYNTLLTQQARIGWDHLLRGKLSVLWRVYQRQFEGQQRFKRYNTRLPTNNLPDQPPPDTITNKPKKKHTTDRFQQFISLQPEKNFGLTDVTTAIIAA